MSDMACRIGCGACCVAPSISSPIPGMPGGKPAGVRCTQLGRDNQCLIYGNLVRPAVCANLRAMKEMCGATFEEARSYLEYLEQCTAPSMEKR